MEIVSYKMNSFKNPEDLSERSLEKQLSVSGEEEIVFEDAIEAFIVC